MRKENYTLKGIKGLITVIAGIAGFVGVFLLDRILINWIVGHFTLDHNFVVLIKIILWLFAIAWTTGIAFAVGFLVGGLAAIIFGLDDY